MQPGLSDNAQSMLLSYAALSRALHEAGTQAPLRACRVPGRMRSGASRVVWYALASSSVARSRPGSGRPTSPSASLFPPPRAPLRSTALWSSTGWLKLVHMVPVRACTHSDNVSSCQCWHGPAQRLWRPRARHDACSPCPRDCLGEAAHLSGGRVGHMVPEVDWRQAAAIRAMYTQAGRH